ncbi:Homeobox-leucine zipper protein HAT2 [Linum grandiflorum]
MEELMLRSFGHHYGQNPNAKGLVLFLLRGIDVNRIPPTADAACDEDEAGVSSPNGTVSSVSGKRSERDEHLGSDPDADSGSSGRAGNNDEEDGDISRKKLRLSKDQSAVPASGDLEFPLTDGNIKAVILLQSATVSTRSNLDPGASTPDSTRPNQFQPKFCPSFCAMVVEVLPPLSGPCVLFKLYQQGTP